MLVLRVWTVSDSVRLFVPSQNAGALCLGFIGGAGGLPRRLSFSCMCAARVPVAPAVGAVLLCFWLVPRWHRVQCDLCVVCWFKLMGPIGKIVLQRDAIGGTGATAQTTAGNPKRAHSKTESRPTRADQQHKNGSIRTRPQTAGDDKKHSTRTGAAETKQHTRHPTALSATK